MRERTEKEKEKDRESGIERKGEYRVGGSGIAVLDLPDDTAILLTNL